MEVINSHGFFRIEKEAHGNGIDRVKITRNDKPEKFIELSVDQMTPDYLASRLSHLGIKNVDLSKLDLNGDGTIDTVSELRKLDVILEKNRDFLNSTEAVDYFSECMKKEASRPLALEMIKNGIDGNARDKQGFTVLMITAIYGTEENAEFLIKKGADVNAKSTYHKITSLLCAAHDNKPELVRLFIKKGADVNAVDGIGRTVLMEANSREVAELLIEQGANVNAKSEFGNTALMRAASRGKVEIVSILLKKGADVNAKNSTGYTALMDAVYSEDPESVMLLLKKGANVNAKNKNGESVLINAFKDKHIENEKNVRLIVRLLIDKGADVNAKDKKGKTVIDYVEERRLDDIVEILKEAQKKKAK